MIGERADVKDGRADPRKRPILQRSQTGQANRPARQDWNRLEEHADAGAHVGEKFGLGWQWRVCQLLSLWMEARRQPERCTDLALAIDGYERNGSEALVVVALDGLADVLVTRGEFEEAHRRLDTAFSRADPMTQPLLWITRARALLGGPRAYVDGEPARRRYPSPTGCLRKALEITAPGGTRLLTDRVHPAADQLKLRV